MNDAILQRLATEIANQTVLKSWPFYILLLAFVFVGTAIGSFLRGRFTKRGEIAATKADFDEIKRQLGETTRTAKSVELALTHSDWLRKEQNTLRRAKLEQLLVAAFGLSSWGTKHIRIEDGQIEDQALVKDEGPIDEFEMLSFLHFHELREVITPVVITYRQLKVQMHELRFALWEIQIKWKAAELANDAGTLNQLLKKREELLEANLDPVTQRAGELYKHVLNLAAAARDAMQKLTSD